MVSTLYLATNESILGIVASLSVKKDDAVLSVCGSGDVPFALLEYAKFVCACDISIDQINYAKYRLAQLNQGRYEEFFNTPKLDNIWITPEARRKQKEYFTLERLEKIRKKSQCISFKIANVCDKQDETFSKIYLSNAPLDGIVSSRKTLIQSFNNLAESLLPEGLLYHAAGEDYVSGIQRYSKSITPSYFLKRELKKTWSRYFEIDIPSTEVASEYRTDDIWQPVVFRKIHK